MSLQNRPPSLSGTVLPNGAIRLGWQSPSASGVFYSVWRRLPEKAKFEQIGLSAGGCFVDSTLPRSTPLVEYRVRTHAGSRVSNPCPLISVRVA